MVCISDTHTKHAHVMIPPADILVHSGDFTMSGVQSEVESFVNWLDSLTQVKHKIVMFLA